MKLFSLVKIMDMERQTPLFDATRRLLILISVGSEESKKNKGHSKSFAQISDVFDVKKL